MNVAQQRFEGQALLIMAEAIVAGRQAGQKPMVTIADNPFDEAVDGERHRAWRRGFWVGRALDD